MLFAKNLALNLLVYRVLRMPELAGDVAGGDDDFGAGACVETIQQRGGGWVLANFDGKGRRILTVTIPIWIKQGINACMTIAELKMAGRRARSQRAERSTTAV
jgi:hypothetical protein